MIFITSKAKEVSSYLFFGVLTTLVNYIVYKFSNIFLGEDKFLISNVIAWIIAVTFAYVTNKLWVFESKSWSASVLKKELPSFIGARLFSLGVEELGLWLLLDICELSAISIEAFGYAASGTDIFKLVMQFIVIVLNYLFSKFFVFSSRKTEKKTESVG